MGQRERERERDEGAVGGDVRRKSQIGRVSAAKGRQQLSVVSTRQRSRLRAMISFMISLEPP